MVLQQGARISQAHFEDAKKHACALLKMLDISLTYHDLRHTFDMVVPGTQCIAQKEGLSTEEKLLVGIYAAYHDTGFLRLYPGHESASAAFLEEYMRNSQFSFDPVWLEWGKKAILNTDMKTPPQSVFEKVLRDADLCAMGHPEFVAINARFREECKRHPKSAMHDYAIQTDDKCWATVQLPFLVNHQWFTAGAKLLYEEQRIKNIHLFKQAYNLP
ncbi:MAG: hypothetical protein V1725_01280 [archaeon]